MKAIKYNSNGEIICVLNMPEEYMDLQIQEGEFLLKDAEADSANQYVDVLTKNLVDIPAKPNPYSIFNWQTKQWEALAGWLDKAKNDNITTVNNLSSQKILPKYPIHLQLNLPYDFGQDSVEVETMRTWVDSVRTLANTAKAEIASATTLEEITTIVDNFKQELAEIS